ncbi:hypothetical protein PRIPAC_79558 [Pristionchus pacificus]|uniref:Uncharacterized protein n=1 Tax=Pristionchus pacificus TaxID=54126 RepID=A0A2A6BVZ7_PRIPA|nr:hypothetical protein PRIPAC_79558 [Pristionchus pacificus]|eukprot:PDM70080.1 hypothetical protein PRIPAC_49292 [Pristionchus pacificus]
MEVDEEERTQNETTSYHSLRTSLSLDDLRTALHHSCASPCKTAISLTRIVEGPDRWRQLLRVVDQEELLADNRPSLTTARRHSFQLSDGDTFALDVPSTTLDQYDGTVSTKPGDPRCLSTVASINEIIAGSILPYPTVLLSSSDPWAPPNTPVEEEDRFLVDCTTTCSTMESISPSASRERISGEVAEYLLVKVAYCITYTTPHDQLSIYRLPTVLQGGAWHANVNDSVRVEVTTPDKRDKDKRGAAERSRYRTLPDLFNQYGNPSTSSND